MILLPLGPPGGVGQLPTPDGPSVVSAETVSEYKGADLFTGRFTEQFGPTTAWGLAHVKYTHLGRSGLSVSRLVLGTMNLGPETSEEDSHTIMDRAHEHGMNFFDTANVYGAKRGEGVTEQIIGRWFICGRRQARENRAGHQALPPDGRLVQRRVPVRAEHPARVRCVTQAAADRLHRPVPDAPDRPEHAVGGDLGGVQRPSPAGKGALLRLVHLAGWHIAQAQEAARSRHFLGLVSEQSIYNLMTRWVELEVLPAARHYGPGVIPWSPLHGGLLGGVLRKQKEGGASRSNSGRSADALANTRKPLGRTRGCAPISARTRPTSAGVAARAGRRDRADHRAADGRATRRLAARADHHTRRWHAGQAGRAGPAACAERGQACARGVRLVITSRR